MYNSISAKNIQLKYPIKTNSCKFFKSNNSYLNFGPYLIHVFKVPPGRTWSLVSWNAGGFFARIKDVQLKSDLIQNDVIMVQETQSLTSPFLPTHDVWAIPGVPGERGRPSGGLAIFVRKALSYSLEQIATDNVHYQICLIRFSREECLLVNVYVPPKCNDAFDLIYSPILAVLESHNSIPCKIVVGDFNARIGDAVSADPEDEFLTLLPPINLDPRINDNRAGFLAFLEAADLRMLNGRSLDPNNPIPAQFTFNSVRARKPPAPPSSCVVARSCIDYVLTTPSLLHHLSPLQLLSYHHSEHKTLSTSVPYLTDLQPDPIVTPILKFHPPDLEVVLTIFRTFDLSKIPPDAHPLSYLIDQIHGEGHWKPKPQPKSWFESEETISHSSHVARLRADARKFHRALVERGELTSFPDFVAARTKWIEAVDEGRRLATTSFQTRLETWKKQPHLPGHSSKLWKVMSGKKSEFGTSIPEDQLVSHFNQLLFKNQPLHYLTPDPPILDPYLDAPFTPDEVRHAIKSKNSNSAPGADQLQYSFWKMVVNDPASLTCLTTLFNQILTTGKVPSDWHTAIVTMLYKGKGPRNLATNFRAISLTSTSLKIFETLLATRISTWAESRKLLSFHQAGFRKNFSTHDHIFTLASLQRQAGRENIFVGFIDLAKAFPSVSRPKLLSKLQNLGLSSRMLDVIADMYSPDSFRFILSGSALGSKSGIADTGTREGSCLSPLLFILFMSDLPAFLDECRSRGPKIGGKVLRVMQFADDTTLLAKGKVQFQKLLDQFALYCTINELTINANKTEIINLRHGARCSKKNCWTLNGQSLYVSKSARYLGVIFGTGKMGLHHAKHLRSRNLAKVWSLVGRVRRAGFTDSRFLFRLFHTLISSSATYGAGLLLPLPETCLPKNLNCLQTNYLRSIWSLPKGTPNHLVLSAANSPCMSCLCLEDALRFLRRKFSRWETNAPLVEHLISSMFEARGSAEDPSPPTWLDHMIRSLSDLQYPPTLSSFPEFRDSVLVIDPHDLHQRITRRCHRTCYPPSPNRAPFYQSLDISTAASWPCFLSTSTHLKLCRFFISDSFRHSKLFSSNNVSRNCPSCDEPLSVQHWLFCPHWSADRQLLSTETGFQIDSLERLRDILQNPRHSVALEFVLSRLFTWK